MAHLFIITGPSAVGKSFLIDRIMQLFPDQFDTPPVVTTRPPRPDEHAADRHFVTQQEFIDMRHGGTFAVADEFQGNWYGFPATEIKPGSKHSIFNTWPALIPEFAAHAAPIFIGMTILPEQEDFLRERMIRRGDDTPTIERRLKQIKIDDADLRSHAALVNAQGKLFFVRDDTTIDTQIIPWLKTIIMSRN